MNKEEKRETEPQKGLDDFVLWAARHSDELDVLSPETADLLTALEAPRIKEATSFLVDSIANIAILAFQFGYYKGRTRKSKRSLT